MDLPPLHDELTFLAPLGEERAELLTTWLAGGLRHGGTALDVGCGWGELLLRVAAAAPAATAVGVDQDGQALAEARRRAADRHLEGRASFVQGDGATAGPDAVEALVCLGASHVWQVADDQPLPYAAALQGLRQRAARSARVVYGDGIWSRLPTPAAVAPLLGREDEFVSLRELTDLATDAGFAVVGVHEASQEEWDTFESGFNAGPAYWLAEHGPDHPDADAVRERARAQRHAYLDGYRGILGFAYLQLLAV